MTAPAKNVVAQPSVAEGAKPLHERIAEYFNDGKGRFASREADSMLREAAEALRNAEDVRKDAARYQWLRKNWVQLMPHDCDGPEYMKLESTWSDWPRPHRTLDAAIDVVLSTGRMR